MKVNRFLKPNNSFFCILLLYFLVTLFILKGQKIGFGEIAGKLRYMLTTIMNSRVHKKLISQKKIIFLVVT